MPGKINYYEFEVSLEGVRPRIWRRFQLRKNSTFLELHDTIQKACGWQNYHLFDFRPVGSQNRLAVSPHERPDGHDLRVMSPLKGFSRSCCSTGKYRYRRE